MAVQLATKTARTRAAGQHAGGWKEKRCEHDGTRCAGNEGGAIARGLTMRTSSCLMTEPGGDTMTMSRPSSCFTTRLKPVSLRQHNKKNVFALMKAPH